MEFSYETANGKKTKISQPWNQLDLGFVRKTLHSTDFVEQVISVSHRLRG